MRELIVEPTPGHRRVAGYFGSVIEQGQRKRFFMFIYRWADLHTFGYQLEGMSKRLAEGEFAWELSADVLHEVDDQVDMIVVRCDDKNTEYRTTLTSIYRMGIPVRDKTNGEVTLWRLKLKYWHRIIYHANIHPRKEPDDMTNPAFAPQRKSCPNCQGPLRGVGTSTGEAWFCDAPGCGYKDTPDTRKEVEDKRLLCVNCNNKFAPEQCKKHELGLVCPNCGVLIKKGK